tara:strand:+ start:2747 stop:3256 length:510 start_codon:yes stop_codon:yes gene_type:complete
MTQKTHFRKAFDSPYLSSADITGNTVLTVKKVSLENDKSKKTKDRFNTLHFKETELRKGQKLKPMILNAINSKTMYNLTKSHYLEDWVDLKITIYVDNNVRFGRETVEGLRISSKLPAITKPALTPDCKGWTNAITAYNRDGNLDAVLKRMTISKQNQKLLIEQANAQV